MLKNAILRRAAARSVDGNIASGVVQPRGASAPFRCRAGDKLLEIDDRFHLFSDPRCTRVVLDLAAAPGSFSEVAVQRMLMAQQTPPYHSSSTSFPNPLVLAVDLQRMKPMHCCQALRCNVLDHARIRREMHRVLVGERHAQRHTMGNVGHLYVTPQVVLHDGVSVVDGQSELSVTYAQTNMAIGSLRLAVDLFSYEATRLLAAADSDNSRTTSSSSRVVIEPRRNSWAFVTKVMPSVHYNQLLGQARKHFNVVDVVRPEACRHDSRERYLVCKQFRCEGRRSHHGAGFSLAPSTKDLGSSSTAPGGRQVMWHCFGCGRAQLGLRKCSRCV